MRAHDDKGDADESARRARARVMSAHRRCTSAARADGNSAALIAAAAATTAAAAATVAVACVRAVFSSLTHCRRNCLRPGRRFLDRRRRRRRRRRQRRRNVSLALKLCARRLSFASNEASCRSERRFAQAQAHRRCGPGMLSKRAN